MNILHRRRYQPPRRSSRAPIPGARGTPSLTACDGSHTLDAAASEGDRMTARPDRSKRRLRLWFWAIPAAAALAIAAWVAWTSDVSLVRADRAASLLVAIEKAAALPVSARGPIERTAPDGPMPEMADRTLVIDADAATIATRIVAACRTAGFRPPDARRRAIEGDVACVGGSSRPGDSVHLRLRCTKTCTAYLQTRLV